jgi:hypothetical protein
MRLLPLCTLIVALACAPGAARADEDAPKAAISPPAAKSLVDHFCDASDSLRVTRFQVA